MRDLIEALGAIADGMRDAGEHEDAAILDRAAAALEAAREDAARLYWLASEAATLWGSRDRGGYELPYFDITSGRECCDPSDLRSAIDQARSTPTEAADREP